MRPNIVLLAFVIGGSCVVGPSEPLSRDIAVEGSATTQSEQRTIANACASAPGRLEGACWTSLVSPTPQSRRRAEQHQKAAAEVRARSEAMRRAEARSCIGLEDEDRDMSPFAHSEDIESVDAELSSSANKGGAAIEGAMITFRATPGMTTEWLQHVVDCHLARNAVLMDIAPDTNECPLVPIELSAVVAPAGDQVAVLIRSKDRDVAHIVWACAQALVQDRTP